MLPASAKIRAILKFPTPEDKWSVKRLIGLVGLHRKVCPNLSIPYNLSLNQFAKSQSSLRVDPRVRGGSG